MSALTALPRSSFSPAVLPRRLRYRQGPNFLVVFRFHHPQDHHGMVTFRVHDPFNLALDVRGQAGQNGRSGPALHKRLSINRRAVRTGREEKPAGYILLPVAYDMERRYPALRRVCA